MTAAVYDPTRVDLLAVEFVCNGTPMRLEGDTLVAAVLAIGHMISSREVARRCGTSTKQVAQILKDNGGLTCPYCKRGILHDDGVLREHITTTGHRCDMSGHRHDDTERLAIVRKTQKAVARS